MIPKKGISALIALVVILCYLFIEENGVLRSIGVRMRDGHVIIGGVENPANLHKNCTVSSTEFDGVVSKVFQKVLDEQYLIRPSNSSSSVKTFNITTWNKKTAGGLDDKDRILLAEVYSSARSVFEYGLGESTYIANHLDVPRYAGIDSDVQWVNEARRKVSAHFRFYYGDVGDTLEWGHAKNLDLAKIQYQYQVAPLQSEPEAFDVYMIDGRYRMACAFLSFLHASARGASHRDTLVLVHDCYRYRKQMEGILDLVDHSGTLLCVYKRRENLTDEFLAEKYDEWRNNED